MIKQDIVDNVASATGLTKVEVEAVLNESFGEIIKALSSNDKIELRGFGSFSLRKRKPIRGRNPKTGTSIELGERRIPYFRASKALNFKINH